jgi:hypothetical protein
VAHRVRDLLRMRDRPRQAAGVQAHHRTTATGETVTTLKDPQRAAYFRLTPEGWFLWQRFDGQHTLRDLAMAYMDEFGAFAPQAVTDLVARLATTGFVEGIPLRADAQRATERTTRSEQALGTARRLLVWRLSIHNVDALLGRLYGALRAVPPARAGSDGRHLAGRVRRLSPRLEPLPRRLAQP